ncbi:hypothetical protein [Alteromonas sp. a30]|uniref:hypothetical protein n=1 Tax=Alteromonas sp. a30 TaxID=2730917 RepID=UPI0022810D05|nr:hypothetical protein [Alteromonas sp. a30]MCY7297037.1 hypothetical protein [Alteromonas sp. a30]
MRRSHLISLITLAIVILAIVLVVPMPQLLKYKSANIVSEAIYWDTFGQSGILSDAQADFVKYDRDTQHLHICYGKKEQTNCQDYRVIENKGVIAALFHWVSKPN